MQSHLCVLLRLMYSILFSVGICFYALGGSTTHNIVLLLDCGQSIDASGSLNQSPDAVRDYEHMPVGMDGMVDGAVAAIDSQSAPVVISRSILKSIVDHHNIFQDFISLSKESLVFKYGEYKRFPSIDSIESLKARCAFINSWYSSSQNMIRDFFTQNIGTLKGHNCDSKKISNVLYRQLASLHGNHGNGNESIPQVFCDKSRTGVRGLNSFLYIEALLYFFSSYAYKSIKKCTVKRINQDLFLLVPQEYSRKFNVEHEVADYNPASSITECEFKLGLRVNHLITEDPSCYSAFAHSYNASDGQRYIDSLRFSLLRLFVSSQEYNLYYRGHQKPIWSIMALGHGRSSYNINKEKRRLEKVHAAYLLSIMSISSSNVRSQALGLLPTYQSLQNNIERAKTDYQDQFSGDIISLSIDSFRDVLRFFDLSLDVGIFYYSSCYAGGEHLVIPYKDLRLHYPVVVEGVSENATTAYSTFMDVNVNCSSLIMPCYGNVSERCIDIDRQDLKLLTPLNFKKFFEYTSKGYHADMSGLSYLIDQIVLCQKHYEEDQINRQSGSADIPKQVIDNIAMVRWPFSSKFSFVPNKKVQSMSLYDSHICTPAGKYLESSSSDLFISDDLSHVYLFGKYINNKIYIHSSNNNTVPFISMQPGESAHRFKFIDASRLTLKEMFKVFFPFILFKGSKAFKIDTLRVKSIPCINRENRASEEYIELKDVIIYYNMPREVNSLRVRKPRFEQDFESGLSFTYDNNTYVVSRKSPDFLIYDNIGIFRNQIDRFYKDLEADPILL